MAKPDKLNIIWGTNGVSVDPGDAKFELGWVAEIPPYQYFNYVLNKHSVMLDHVNTYGIPEWDVATSYVLGSRVIYSGILYRCTVASSVGQTPNSSGDWLDVEDDLNTKITANETDISTNTSNISTNTTDISTLETKTPQSYKPTDNVVFNTINTGYGANNVVPDDTFNGKSATSVTLALDTLLLKQTGYQSAICTGPLPLAIRLPAGGTYSYQAIDFSSSIKMKAGVGVAGNTTIFSIDADNEALFIYKKET